MACFWWFFDEWRGNAKGEGAWATVFGKRILSTFVSSFAMDIPGGQFNTNN